MAQDGIISTPRSDVERRAGSAARLVLPPRPMALARAANAWVRRRAMLLRLLHEALGDVARFYRWSHDGRRDRHRLQRESALIKHYHGLEKGLSLAEPRVGFGEAKARALADRLDVWAREHGHDSVTDAAEGSLRAYYAFNRDRGLTMPWLEDWLRGREDDGGQGDGGVKVLRRAELQDAVRGVGPAFFESRHSVRDFSADPVPLEVIEAAVDMARHTPSVCNRQGPRAYCFHDAMEALRWQPGNAGFGHLASRALVITADLQAFSSPGERHQAYVDGGLFAMSVVYALHALGYGTCMLAWSQERARDDQARAALSIPPSEVIIMMIAVGCIPEQLRVARSWRRPLSEILQLR